MEAKQQSDATLLLLLNQLQDGCHTCVAAFFDSIYLANAHTFLLLPARLADDAHFY